MTTDDYEIIERQEATLGQAALATIQSWLQPTDYDAESSEYHRHLSSQAPNTGLWILRTSEFRQWHDASGHGSLWIKGVPGAGKSVVSATITEHLKRVENVPVLFFFFREIIVTNRKPRSLICDWLSQLVPHSIQLQAALQPLLDCELGDVSDDQLWQYLLAGLSTVNKAYCVIDALDEMQMSGQDGFFSRLNDLFTFRPNAVKVLMTSRPKQYLQRSLRDTSIIHVNLQQALVDDDIEAYVLHRLSSVLDDLDSRQSLVSTVSKRSRGLFLYARLLLDQIIHSIPSLQNADISNLSSILPVGLAEMYDNVLAEQAKSLDIESRVQVLILELVTHSVRPMRLNEIASFLGYLRPDLQNPKSIARSACGPLLEILEDETVQVIHHSLTEFLLGSEQEHVFSKEKQRNFPVLEPLSIHKRLTIAILSYLQSGALLTDSEKEKQIFEEEHEAPSSPPDVDIDGKYDYDTARLQHPFLHYATTNWAYHASHYDVQDDELFQAIEKFLDPTSTHFRRWVFQEWSPTKTKLPSALHVAAFAGLTEYAKFGFKSNNDVDIVDADDRTPLWWAARRNQVTMASLLLQKGAKPDPDDRYGNKPLHEAAKKDHFEIVEMLLQAGVDLLTPKTKENSSGMMPGGSILTKGETAVDYACAQGHAKTIQVMIRFAQPEALVQILCDSCRHGKPEAVRAVLENSNVAPDSKLYGATALYLATLARSVQCVEALLAKGTSVDLESRYTFPSRRLGPRPTTEALKRPLNALTKVWRSHDDAACRAILNLLLEAGANLEYVDGEGETALLNLFSAPYSKNPNREAIEAFLKAGSDIKATDKSGGTILHRCVENCRDVRLIGLILHYGADIEAQDHKGRTLWHALFSSSLRINGADTISDVVNYLLEQGAGRICPVQDSQGKTALEKAASCRNCDFEAFKSVFQASPEETARRRCLWSLISADRGSPEFYKELVSAGISLEERDKQGRTALLWSVRNPTGFKTLLDCGAQLDAVDDSGKGVLHHYITMAGSNPSASRLQDLVEMGINPKIVDNYGNTLLHEAVFYYMGTPSNVEFVEQILNYGIDVNAKNHLGRTALHIYFESNRSLSTRRELKIIHFLHLLLDKAPNLNIDAQDNDGVTALHISASRSELDVDRLLSAGANPSITTNNGDNALHIACESEKSNILALLLGKTGDSLKDEANNLKRTPLHTACRCGPKESVYFLLRSGADIHAKDSKGRTPLHSCAEFEIEKSLKRILKHSYRDIVSDAKSRFKGVSPNYFSTPRPTYASSWRPDLPKLHDTRSIGSIISMLINAGADVIAKDSDQQTPLDLAIFYECQQMIDALQHTVPDVQKCWDIKENNLTLSTVVALSQKPRVSALENTKCSLKDVLADPGYYINMLNMPDIEFLLKAGADIFAEKIHFTKPSLLHMSAETGRIDVAERLGSLMNTFDNPDFVRGVLETKERNKTAVHSDFEPILHTACNREFPNLPIIECLVNKCGVDVNAQALIPSRQHSTDLVLGPTALHVLAESQFWWQLLAIPFLVEKGAIVDARDSTGQTPLHIACKGHRVDHMGKHDGYWSQECVKVLLDLGADPNALDNEGRSPIHKAGSSPEIIGLLIQRGANLLAGKVNPLFAAIQEQNVEALRVILELGTDPNIIDNNKSCQVHYTITDQARTALFCATFPGKLNVRTQDSVPLVVLLLLSGADPFAPLNEHETLIHYVFENAEYSMISAYLEFSHQIDLNKTDQRGRNVLHAACDWTQQLPKVHRRQTSKSEQEADLTSPIIKLLSTNVNILATDNEDRNALHHILDNPHMDQDTILQLLARDEIKPLLLRPDKQGLKPFHLALRFLRPLACEKLLTIGCNILEPDPTNGATVLHYIASQYLSTTRSIGRMIFLQEEKLKYWKNHRDGCIRLWHKYMNAGGNINVGDNNSSPPLFYYLSSSVQDDLRPTKGSQDCCHVDHFSGLFGDYLAEVNMFAVNKHGETALHRIAHRQKSYYLTPEHEKRLFEFMIKKGLDPLQEDNERRSSLDVATVMGKSHAKEGILAMFQYQA